MKRKRWMCGALALVLCSGLSPVKSAGNADRGRQLYESRCIGCHSLDANRVGPAHRGVVGRRAGSLPDYDYSAALRKSALVWTDANLDRWLADPERLIPGQKMGYRVEDAAERADLIAYLRSASEAVADR